MIPEPENQPANSQPPEPPIIQPPIATNQKVFLPRDLQTTIPEIFMYHPVNEFVVEGKELNEEDLKAAKQFGVQKMRTNDNETEAKLEQYLVLLGKLTRKYENMKTEIFQLQDLIGGVLSPVPSFVVYQIQKAYNSDTKNVEKIANKYKVLYSKGRGKQLESHNFLHIRNCVQNCFEIIHRESQIEKNKKMNKVKSQKTLVAISKSFQIIGKGSIRFYKTHPQTLPQSKQDPLKFFVSFYVESLLIQSPTKYLDFPSNLLYCPILFSKLSNEYYIDNNYLELLGSIYPNWDLLSLCVDVAQINEQEEVIFYRSYFKRTYYEPDNLVLRLLHIRDKIYQLIIFRYLQYLFDSKEDYIVVPFSKTLRIKIYLIEIDVEQKERSEKYRTQFITFLLAYLRDEKLPHIPKITIRNRIKYRMEEMFIQRSWTQKFSQTIHFVKDDDLPPTFRKSKLSDTKQFYKILQNQN